jgi:beta-xylosidase
MQFIIKMKLFKLLAVILMLPLACSTSRITTSIMPGEIWKDNRGMHINAHGGGILFLKGVYYWYGEHKDELTNVANVGINCYSSKDLINWKFEGVVLPVVTDNDSSEIVKGCIMERPKVVYNEKTKKYVLWFHLELKGQGYKAARVGLAISDSPTGTFQYIHSYRPNAGIYPLNMTDEQKSSPLTVADFPKSFSPEWRVAVENGMFVRRDLAGGQMSRDMTIFVDEDKKAYHIYASEENLTLQIAELSDDYTSHTGRYVRILPGKHNEAPAILKKDGKYFLITSGCTGWAPNAARMAVADNLFGEWTELGNPCVGENANLTFNSQGTFIQKVEGKKDMYIFMADRWNPKTPIDGRYVWLPIEFEADKPVLRWHSKWDMKEQRN